MHIELRFFTYLSTFNLFCNVSSVCSWLFCHTDPESSLHKAENRIFNRMDIRPLTLQLK